MYKYTPKKNLVTEFPILQESPGDSDQALRGCTDECDPTPTPEDF